MFGRGGREVLLELMLLDAQVWKCTDVGRNQRRGLWNGNKQMNRCGSTGAVHGDMACKVHTPTFPSYPSYPIPSPPVPHQHMRPPTPAGSSPARPL
eukprot:366535-Chlamydomonas_euryale.AAC.2